MSPIPAWLAQRDRADIGRAATLGLCHTCHRPVLRGLDGDWLAVTAECDPTSLTRMGEAIALITGRRTYVLTPGPHRKELDYRDEWRIAHHTTNPVLAAHQCHAIDLTPFATPATPRKAADANDQPPY